MANNDFDCMKAKYLNVKPQILSLSLAPLSPIIRRHLNHLAVGLTRLEAAVGTLPFVAAGFLPECWNSAMTWQV